MFKDITDVIVTIFVIAMITFMVRNASGTSSIIRSGSTGFRDVLKAVTFQ